MTKYRVADYGLKPYKVLSELDHEIFYQTKDGLVYGELTISTTHSWHDTFPQAQAELIRRTEQEIRLIEERLKKKKELLKTFKKLKA